MFTLRNKFWFFTLALVTPVFFLGGISFWNLVVQGRAMRAATVEYEVTDRSQAVAVQVGWLRDVLRGGDAQIYYNLQYFVPIQNDLREITARMTAASAVDDGDARSESALASDMTDQFQKATTAVAARSVDPAKPAEVAAQLDHLHESLLAASLLGPAAARRHVIAAEAATYSHKLWGIGWFLVILTLSAVVHFKQYQTLVRPLIRLRDNMRRSAATEYRTPVLAEGDPEFLEMAAYFNGLAKELAELYRGLEQKVIAKSRELVRSERLASVGFLAAGVAHEINNPLSVISGYAELSSKSLDQILSSDGQHAPTSNMELSAQAEAEALVSILDAQKIIREEAFRCKEITTRLLSLARGGTDNRETVSLLEIAQQVSTLTKGLRNYRDRTVSLNLAPDTSWNVIANVTEMKQVILNLVVNALEASPAKSGHITISGRRSGEWVEIQVEDNGKGMSPDVLQQIFEPFFTAKRGAGEPGTGLGLSITHAIIENHGGHIEAHSDGAGRGSRFVFRLPAATKTTQNGRRALVAERSA